RHRGRPRSFARSRREIQRCIVGQELPRTRPRPCPRPRTRPRVECAGMITEGKKGRSREFLFLGTVAERVAAGASRSATTFERTRGSTRTASYLLPFCEFFSDRIYALGCGRGVTVSDAGGSAGPRRGRLKRNTAPPVGA